MSERRQCTGTTKRGTPCQSPPLKGADTCLAHADEETRGSVRFGGSQEGSGRPPKARPTDVARRLVEENVAAVLRPHFRALGYDVALTDGDLRLVELEGGAKLYGTSKDGEVVVSGHDDLGAMIAAAEKLLDRIYGRPRQALEHTGDGGGPVEVGGRVSTTDLSKLNDEQLAQLQELLAHAAR